MREMVFGLDADFSEEAFVGRLNADLANDLGNLASRATTLLASGGGIARVPSDDELSGVERGIKSHFEAYLRYIEAAMDEFAFQKALALIWDSVAILNGYVDTTKPWALAKQAGARPEYERVLYVLAEGLRFLGIVLAPFLPEAARKIRAALRVESEPRLADTVWGRLEPGTRIDRLSGLFPRVETAARQASASGAPRASGRPPSVEAAAKAPVTINDFGKIELRVAEVLAAEPVPKSKKLLKLTVSLGAERRTLVAGIAEHYAAADLVGKKVVVVANLAPATLMGVESNGMLLAGSADGKLAVLTLDRDLPPGAKVQ